MLKISDYLAITAGFLGLLVFYLIFSGNLRIDYGTESRLPVIEQEEAGERVQPETARYVVLYGNEEESRSTSQVMQMLERMKKFYIAKETAAQLTEEQKETADIFIITTDSLEEADAQHMLLELVKADGKYLLYTNLPDESGEYEKELGILESRGKTQIDGMMIFEGILAQGMVNYADLPMTVGDLSLDAACTKLIQEQSKEFKEQRELIPLLWKKQWGKGKIYVCNAPFFEEESGIGILTGIFADMEETFLYPVVNSSAVLLDYYPDTEHADRELIYRLYSREPAAYIRDVVWPAMEKIGHEEGLVISGRTHMQDKDEEFYDTQRQMQRNKGIVMEADEGDFLPVISEGHTQADEKRFRMDSASSGCGLASCYLDMREIMGSKGEQESFEWAAYSLELTKNMHNLYGKNHFLESVDWLEAQERLKRYERIQPAIEISDDHIQIRADGFVDVWYCMVRTGRDLKHGQGYEIQKVGEQAYLLEIRQQEIRIPMQ
ncbi:DUF2194 domain-containing protein [Lachnospiraceae bacterium 64-25]